MAWSRRLRSASTPSSIDVDLRGIPTLSPGGWRLYSTEEWPLIGAVPKGFLAFGDPERASTLAYIAKRPRIFGPRECVTEEIISQIGRTLPLRVAESRLVRLPGDGSDVRFMSRYFLRRGEEELLHGIELVALYLGSSVDEVNATFKLTDKREERRFYTVDLIVKVLEWWGRNEVERRKLCASFGRMIAFDALIGAPDRHALNWGTVSSLAQPSAPRRFAPLFDTARGLFVDHTEEHLRAFEKEPDRTKHLDRYATRSNPVLGCGSREGGDRVNHFELVRYVLRELRYPLGSAVEQMVAAFDESGVRRLLNRKFRRLLTTVRLGLIADLLSLRAQRLRMIVSDCRRPR